MEIRPTILDSVLDHLRDAYPNEGCGFLVGSLRDDGRVVVREARPIANQREEDHAARNRYLISPAHYLAAEREADARDLAIVGAFHSHPDAPARPSDYDREHAWPSWRYLIVSVVDGTPREYRAWELRSDREAFVEHEIAITEENQ